MNHYLTADLHFNHANIIEHCGRPFRSVEGMNEALMRRFNATVKPDDICYILGDLCFRTTGGWKGQQWLDALNGHKVLVRGNHDNNNSAKTILRSAYIKFGGRTIALIHDPADDSDDEHAGGTVLHRFCQCADLILCGHVHEKWKHRWYGDKLAVNVGVDQWGFRPVKLDDAVEYARQQAK